VWADNCAADIGRPFIARDLSQHGFTHHITTKGCLPLKSIAYLLFDPWFKSVAEKKTEQPASQSSLTNVMSQTLSDRL